MLKTWKITYQIGTHPARIATCHTDFPVTDEDFQKMISISNGVTQAEIRLVKILRVS